MTTRPFTALRVIQRAGYLKQLSLILIQKLFQQISVSDKLYFEPLTLEDVLNVVDLEQPVGVIVQFGGQTAINLAEGLVKNGV